MRTLRILKALSKFRWEKFLQVFPFSATPCKRLHTGYRLDVRDVTRLRRHSGCCDATGIRQLQGEGFVSGIFST
jgi:hypothetical protein